MANSNEEISKNTTVGGRTDSNISNDSNHLGGIPADDFATKTYVQNYYNTKEGMQKQYIDEQNAQKLVESKSYTDTVVSNQDFSSFAKLTDLQTLNTNLTSKINNDITSTNNLTDNKIEAVVTDVNTFNNQTTQQINSINSNLNSLNSSMNVANSNINYLNLQLNQETRNRQIADNSLQQDISTLQESVTNTQGNISTLQSNMTTVQGKVSNLENNVSGLQRNVSNIETDIDSLENTTQELFTSVSNGKQLIATAITDKGIITTGDSSFSTMANNISQIQTGIDTSDATATGNDILLGKTAYSKGNKIYGSHVDLDTSDANATGEDIMLGKTAYVNGSKVYGSHIDLDTSDANATSQDIVLGKSAYVDGNKITGTHIDLDTSDATATPDDILLGKTAYVNGNKVYGTYVADDQKQYPTYGTDTSNATVNSPDDLAYGKTAYSNGQLIIGSGNLNSNVQEFYKPVTNDFEFKENNLGTGDPPDGQPKTVYRRKISVSHNGDYVVIIGASVASPSQTQYYIESFPLGENGIYYMASTGLTSGNTAYKKYRYTRDELGIPDEEEIKDVIFGSPGLNGTNTQCYLIITTNTGLRFYTYHLKENGVIGKEYNAQENIVYNKFFSYSVLTAGGEGFYSVDEIFSSATLPNVFYGIDGQYMRMFKIIETVIDGENNYQLIPGNVIRTSDPYIYKSIYCTRDGKYILYSLVHRYGNASLIQKLDNSGNIVASSSFSSIKQSLIVLFDSNILIDIYGSGEIKVIELTISNNSISTNLIKTIYTNNISGYSIHGSAIITSDNSKIFVSVRNSSNVYSVAMFDVNEILNAENGENVEMVVFHGSKQYSSYELRTTFSSNYNCSNIKMYVQGGSDILGNYNVSLTNELVGVRYKGMYFNKVQEQLFTAGQPDVRQGKTFIGWMGYPEVGTMQTS